MFFFKNNIFISRDIHLNCKGHSAQIVVTASQIFSRTVGSCFELAEMPAHAYFCYTVNDYFDAMNSSKVFSSEELVLIILLTLFSH